MDTRPSPMQDSENPLWAEEAVLPHHPPNQQHPFRADDTPECPEISPFANAFDPFTSSRPGNLATATKGAMSSRHLTISRRVASASGKTITAKGFYKEGAPKKAFSTGVLGCMSNCSLCCVGICCLSCLYGDNYSRVHGKGCVSSCLCCLFCPCFACCYAAELRLELRAKYGLLRDHNDFALHTFCSPCAVCQEARELLALRVGMEGV